MIKEDFENLFEEKVREPLYKEGFKSYGKSVFVRDKDTTVSLIRLGGRLSTAGSIAYILCFRHSFLRGTSETVPSSFSSNPFDYPFKFKPSFLRETDERLWRYSPVNLQYKYDILNWKGESERMVIEELQSLYSLVSEQFLPWCRAQSPALILEQLKLYGESAWIEKLWIEDYVHHTEL